MGEWLVSVPSSLDALFVAPDTHAALAANGRPAQELDVWSLLALSGLLGIALCLSIVLKLDLEGRMLIATFRYV